MSNYQQPTGDHPTFSDMGLAYWWRKNGPWPEVLASVGEWVTVEIHSHKALIRLQRAAQARRRRNGWDLDYQVIDDVTMRIRLNSEPIETRPRTMTPLRRERVYVKGQGMNLSTEEGWH